MPSNLSAALQGGLHHFGYVMHKTKQLTFNSKAITVHELTAFQVEGWQQALGENTEGQHHLLDNLMGRALPVSVIRISVPDLTDEDLLAAPSELKKVYDAVEAVNPFLSKMAENMARLGGELLGGGLDQEKV